MSSAAHARAVFPSALTDDELLARILTRLRQQRISPERTLLALSMCVDDANSGWLRFAHGQLAGPFLMGGLAGTPIVGAFGVTALADHVPDNGAAVVVFGAHVGVGEHGEWGRLNRLHRARQGACCGTLATVLEHARASQAAGSEGPLDRHDDDLQLALLERSLWPGIDAVLQSERPMLAVAELLYETLRQQVHQLLGACRSHFNHVPILTFGGVIINTAPHHQDLFDLRGEWSVDHQGRVAALPALLV